MKRREFIPSFGGALLGSAAIACPRAASAQQKFKIGLLVAGADMNMAFFSEPFISKLAEFGYVEGKNLSVERRSAEGNIARLKESAADLVRQNVNVIVTVGTPAAFAAKETTTTIPIVLGAMSDPVGMGLVASLARPGGT